MSPARSRIRPIVVIAGATAVLAGCGGSDTLTVTGPHPTGAAVEQCAALVRAAPEAVDDRARRTLSPPNRFAAAWGDPPIILRCGGARPPALRPTSQCFGVNGVGWLVTQHGTEVDPTGPISGPLEFTTIGRSAYVEVQVPERYQPAADALVDLAAAVKAHTRLESRCR